MFDIVRIGDKEVPMLSMASVDVYYRDIFHQDPIKMQTADGYDYGDLINFISRMGFVMAKFAELKDRKEMRKLNEDMFLDWMDGFPREDLMAALPAMRGVYEGQLVEESEEKKRAGEQPGE